MLKIDAMGDVCPLPVIKVKKALKESSEILIRVDNEIATQNLTKMAKQLNLKAKVEKITEKDYQVFIFSENKEVDIKKYSPTFLGNKYVVVISGNTMGAGDDKLGHALLKGFIYSLTEQELLPENVIFYNGGATLTSEGSSVLDDLRQLKSLGVEVLTCGACLDFFGLKEKLAVGEVTNMYHIVELMSQFHVVKP